jgi:hypothetical protein
MTPIKSVDYIYLPNGQVREAIITYVDGTKKVAKTAQDLAEIQQSLNAQQRQILIEKPAAGKPV